MYRAPKGTRDILPNEADRWNDIEHLFRRICDVYGYGEIRTPIFEEEALFIRSIGDETDIVKKEMYDFQDKGGRKMALKPEGTAPVVRAFIQNGMASISPLTRLYYISPMFRYDRPQAGRYREFHQLGVEAIGSDSPLVDVEVVRMAAVFLKECGLSFSLLINTVGCAECRKEFTQALRRFVEDKSSEICDDCRRRYETNPLRILDCKNEQCILALQKAPEITSYICPPCREHFHEVKRGLEETSVAYRIEPRLVRGLDYYTRTAFEFSHSGLGAQASVAGGGRYDKLIKDCGGPDVSGIGFAIGMERLLLAMESENLPVTGREKCLVYIAGLGAEARRSALKLLYELRDAGCRSDMSVEERSLKSQLRSADKAGCRWTVIIGQAEQEMKIAIVKDMHDGGQQEMPLEKVSDFLIEYGRKGNCCTE